MDIDYLLWLQGLRESWGSGVENFFVIITQIGMPHYLLFLIAAIYYCVDRRAGARIFASGFLAIFVNEFLKVFVCCYRPFIRDTRLHVAAGAASGAIGYSFPSGHSALAGGVFGAVSREFRSKRGVVVACVVLIALIIFSRNFLGCHTPQEVVVGLGLGLLAVYVSGRVFDWVEQGEGRDLTILWTCLAASVAVLVITLVKPYPLDYDAAGNLIYDPKEAFVSVFYSTGAFDGMIVGLVLERRLVRFENVQTWGSRLVRLIPGLVLTFVVLVCSFRAAAVLNPLLGYFLIGILPVLFATLVWPAIFVRIERRKSASK